jgi:hypothetical protein
MPGFKPAVKTGKGKAGAGKAPARGHATAGKAGGCGTGAGGFQKGNTCGQKGNRNATVETARAAHQSAKNDVARHLKAHRAAVRKAAKTGETVAHPKELHAAVKRAAAAHTALAAARDTHKATQRGQRNARAREARAVKAGKASPLSAKPATQAPQPLPTPKPPARTGQARPAPTDRGTSNDRLAVVAARHKMISKRLHEKSHEFRKQANAEAPGHGYGASSHAISGSRGRGLGGAAVGRVAIGTPRSRAMEKQADALFQRARAHSERARGFEGKAVAGKIEEAKARVKERNEGKAAQVKPPEPVKPPPIERPAVRPGLSERLARQDRRLQRPIRVGNQETNLMTRRHNRAIEDARNGPIDASSDRQAAYARDVRAKKTDAAIASANEYRRGIKRKIQEARSAGQELPMDRQVQLLKNYREKVRAVRAIKRIRSAREILG